MIFFSDFILSQKPWSYCRLDEPVGYNLYLDSSGNGNHMRAVAEGMVADNRQEVTFAGDPFAAGINPTLETQTLSLGSVNFSITDTALQFAVPQFKSDTWVYRRREKIQNDLAINTMWVDFLMKVETPPYYEYMKNWMPPLHAYDDSRMSVDHLYLNEEFAHIDGLGGGILSSPMVQRTQPYIMHETFLRFGSLALVGITGVHYDYDGSYVGNSYRLSLVTRVLRDGEIAEKVLWSRTLVSEDESFNPSSPLSAGTHRLTIGILAPTSYSMTLQVSVDGGVPVTANTALSGAESYTHDTYSKIALMNNTVFSNLAVFFNRPYPSNEWLSASQKALTRPYHPPISEEISVLHGIAPSGYPMIERLPGSLLNVLNGILFLGTNHRLVTQMFKTAGSSNLSARITPSIPGIVAGNTVKINQNKQSPFSGCWRIYSMNTYNSLAMKPAPATMIPATISFGAVDYDRSYRFTNKDFLTIVGTKTQHHFRLNDLVTVHHLTDTMQSHTWTVTAVDDNGFDVVASGLSDDYLFNDDCLIKQTPIGGGCWAKTFTDNFLGLSYRDIVAYKKNILIDDRESTYAKVSLSKIDNSDPSENLYIPKDIKNRFNHEMSRFTSKASGDCHRLYLFLPSKQNTVSHTSVVSFGEVLDWFNQDWCAIAMVSLSKNKDQDIGFNYAFLYPEWFIDQETGFLICRSFKSHASDGQIQIGKDDVIVSSSGYGDTGEHVYPINVPYISFVP